MRGLLWRSHWHRLGFSAHRHRYLGEEIGEAGGQCLRDMRVRTRGAHHQKFVVIRYVEDPTRDIAYVGGIDLCHGRRDDHTHDGDPQPVELAKAYGPTPPWHDVQVAIQGPAVHDVETTFRERWEDSTPLTLNPGRLVSSWVHREDLSPEPLGAQTPPPPPRPDGHDVVQIIRTFPVILPKGFDFAPEGERSVMLGNTKAIAHADRLVYVEDQYLWSDDVGEHFATALRENPELRLVVVLPMVPDREGALAEVPQLYGRSLAMRMIIEAGGDRVAVFGLCNEAGLPIYVHSKTCVIDHRWASVGSDNLNRRSWTSDSEIACTVVDERGDLDEPAPEDSFPRVLLRTLVAEHLGCDADDVPEDPHELFDAMVACADALDEWYAGGAPDKKSGIRGVLTGRVPHRIAPVPKSVATHIPGHRKAPSASGRPGGGDVEARVGARRPPAGTTATAGRTGAHRRPAPLGAPAVRPAVRPRWPAASRGRGLNYGQETGRRRMEQGPPRCPPRRPRLRPGRDEVWGDSRLGGRQEVGQAVLRAARQPAERAAGAVVRERAGRAGTERCCSSSRGSTPPGKGASPGTS